MPSQTTPSEHISDDYIINTSVVDRLSSQYTRVGEQVPISLAVPGPRHLRGRATSYSPSLGSKGEK